MAENRTRNKNGRAAGRTQNKSSRAAQRRFTYRMQLKLGLLFWGILLILIGILAYIVYINISKGTSYAQQVLSQENYDSRVLRSRRGEIQDTNGRLLAYSEKVYNVVIDCKELNQYPTHIEPTIEALVAVFGDYDGKTYGSITYEVSAEALEERIKGDSTKDSQYQVLVYKISQEEMEAFEAYQDAEDVTDAQERARRQLISSIWFEEEFVRRYPLDSLASHVIGFASSTTDGLSTGLEAYYNTQLAGTNGRTFGYLNESAEYERESVAPENGYTLRTTLDVNIQQAVEECIAEFHEAYGEDQDDGTAKQGAKNLGVIVMNPQNGAILAMASNLGYDLNNPQDLSDFYTQTELEEMTSEQKSTALFEMWSNFCISSSFEPGSTFKPITIAAALESGAISEDDVFTCDGGESVSGVYIRCDVYPASHGTETLGEALQNSCNDALMQIGSALGIDRFLSYQSLFNFGKKTGIDLPSESTGLVFGEDNLNEIELATCTFGQGLTCTMIQEAAAFCAIINGGYYYQPHVVEKILDENGKVITDSSSLLLKQVISGETSELIREYLELVVSDGTGSSAQVAGYRVGGKTGTAEKIENQVRADGKYLVSFIGAIPINNPEVVIYVVVDEPNVENQAQSIYAQALFQKIATEILPYMGIYPTENVTAEMLESMGLTFEDIAESVAASEVTFGAMDENGNYYSDARVKNGVVVDSSDNPIAGARIDEDGTVYDAYENEVAHVDITDSEADSDPKVENPNIASPPIENGTDDSSTTLWDAAAAGNTAE